ncbi:sigma-70 family RNA polymerase sigma factor [Porphyrobacter sp. ULC335]|uniref:sigma-70 family RNA polymerase sigma factor n=1 Tax=Porphyrobacter sp. ULC335 TaxID=2854260 RepID=UPI00221F75BA|nr:sigma-70 family RNA polymerase sigma factor [Porphyrobacter sp. ULC335]
MSGQPITPSAALQQAYLANRERLVRFLRARGAGEAAEDLAQDLWLRLSSGPDPVAAAGLGYMMRAADRLMIDRYRAERQGALRDKAWAESQPGLSDNIAPAPGADRTIAARQQFALVDDALAAVGDRAAAIFRRHRIDGMTQRDIAAEFGISLSTVESDLRRAYAAILEVRRALDEV